MVEGEIDDVCSEPPRIDSFSFPRRKLYDRVSVSCVVSSGDLPISIAWTKDGAEIPHQLGVVVQVRQSTQCTLVQQLK